MLKAKKALDCLWKITATVTVDAEGFEVVVVHNAVFCTALFIGIILQ